MVLRPMLGSLEFHLLRKSWRASRGHDHLMKPLHMDAQGLPCSLDHHFGNGACLRMTMKTIARMPKIRRPSKSHLYFSTPETLLRWLQRAEVRIRCRVLPMTVKTNEKRLYCREPRLSRLALSHAPTSLHVRRSLVSFLTVTPTLLNRRRARGLTSFGSAGAGCIA